MKCAEVVLGIFLPYEATMDIYENALKRLSIYMVANLQRLVMTCLHWLQTCTFRSDVIAAAFTPNYAKCSPFHISPKCEEFVQTLCQKLITFHTTQNNSFSAMLPCHYGKLLKSFKRFLYKFDKRPLNLTFVMKTDTILKLRHISHSVENAS